MLAHTIAANAIARVSPSAYPERSAQTYTASTATSMVAPSARLTASMWRLKSGSRGSRGGRRMTCASVFSASYTSVQAGIDHELEEHHVHGKEKQRPAEHERQERHAGRRHVHRDDVAHRVADVVVDAPPQPHGVDDRAEVVLEQHEMRGLARDVGAAAAHGDADVRGLERRRVVHAVAGHRDHFAGRAVRLHQAQLLLRTHAREHVHPAHAPARAPRRPCAAISLPVSAPPATSMPASARDAQRRPGIVAGDHHHADAGLRGTARPRGHRGAQRIGELDEPDEAERIARRIVERCATPRPPRRPRAAACRSPAASSTASAFAGVRAAERSTVSGAPLMATRSRALRRRARRGTRRGSRSLSG